MTLDKTLSNAQIDVLSSVYVVLLIPSAIGSLSVLLVSIIKWKNLRTQVDLLVQLALADLLAALILMSTSIMNFINTEYRVILCRYLLPLSLTFIFISYLLVVVYAWKSKTALQGWRETTTDDGQSYCRKKVGFLPIYGIVWLTPFAMYLAYLLTSLSNDNQSPTTEPATSPLHNSMSNVSSYCTSCVLFLHFWMDPCNHDEQIHDTYIKVFLFLMVIPAIICCSAIHYKIGEWYKKHEEERFSPVEGDGLSRRRLKSVVSTARNMVMVIIICWAPALVLFLFSIPTISKRIEQHNLFGLYVVQAATVSLQGFMNSMVYAWRRPNFTDAVRETRPLLLDETPFYDESLRTIH